MSKVGIPVLQVGGDGVSAAVGVASAVLALPTLDVDPAVNPKWVAVSVRPIGVGQGVADAAFVKLGDSATTVTTATGIPLRTETGILILNAAGHTHIAHIAIAAIYQLHVVPLASQ